MKDILVELLELVNAMDIDRTKNTPALSIVRVGEQIETFTFVQMDSAHEKIRPLGLMQRLISFVDTEFDASFTGDLYIGLNRDHTLTVDYKTPQGKEPHFGVTSSDPSTLCDAFSAFLKDLK